MPSREDRAPMMQRASRSACATRGAGRSRFRSARRRRSARSASCWRWRSSSIRCRAPDVIVHSTSSGGTQAGLVAGCRLLDLHDARRSASARTIRAASLQAQVRAIVSGIADLLDLDPRHARRAAPPIEVDDRFVGDGYGIPTDESREAMELAARTEAIFLDPTYTAKAMAGLIAYVRQQKFKENQTVVFWHTGGQVGLFA